jgi:hypothetical protein
MLERIRIENRFAARHVPCCTIHYVFNPMLLACGVYVRFPDKFRLHARRLSLVAALPKLRHLTEEEAARRLGVTLAELQEANTFALVTFADPDPEFPPRIPTEAEREAARDRIPKKMAERQAEGGDRRSRALSYQIPKYDGDHHHHRCYCRARGHLGCNPVPRVCSFLNGRFRQPRYRTCTGFDIE